MVAAVASVLLNSHGLSVITNPNTTYVVDVGSLPVNALLFYFLAGFASDRLGKGRPRWVGWVVFAVCMVLITLVFRIWGGYRTVLG